MSAGFNQPLGGDQMPRCAGPATFMRLPEQAGIDCNGVDVAFVGVPFDIGTSNRPGARLAPRAIRDESRLLRPCNLATGRSPFECLQVVDGGDVAIDTYSVEASLAIIERHYRALAEAGVTPLTLGGDHTITLPILRALVPSTGPVGLIHIDAHADSNDTMFGQRYTHGTTFRRAQEEGLLDAGRVVQIGLRGTGYAADDLAWGRRQGFWQLRADELWYQSLAPLMERVRTKMGLGPVYLSFDIDGLDPAFAPGTGTPEIGGLTVVQGLEIVRGCTGLNVVGADLVEVSPPFDLSGNTALLAANLLYEMLCVLPFPER